MESLARAATLLEAEPQALEMSTPREESATPDFATFTPEMFKERFLTQLMNDPIGGDAAWCFNVALKYKKSTGQYCRAFFKLCLRRMIYFHEVETRPAVTECMGVYVNWAAYVEAPVVDAKTEHSKMLPMRNLAELMILEDVLTRKVLFDKELTTMADESPTLQTMLTKIEVSALPSRKSNRKQNKNETNRNPSENFNENDTKMKRSRKQN